MTTSEVATFDDVLCHCDAASAGHSLDVCGTTLKHVAVRPFRAGPTRIEDGASTTLSRASDMPPLKPSIVARGTCPACGRAGVKVTAPWRTLHHPEFVDGVRLGPELELAPHRGPGRSAPLCEHRGGPVETVFTPSSQLAGFRRDLGPKYIR